MENILKKKLIVLSETWPNISSGNDKSQKNVLPFAYGRDSHQKQPSSVPSSFWLAAAVNLYTLKGNEKY